MIVELLDFKSYSVTTLSLFFILGILFIPLTFYGLDFQYILTKFIFLKPVGFVQSHFFSGAIKNIDFSSDTIGLNILICFLLAIAFLSIALLSFLKIESSKIIILFKSLTPYYIAGVLLKYGFDKVFKQQFYLPEPNILYTNFGALTKDILFWSTMGTSYSYSIVTGSIEVLTAMLILIKRTRTLGFCLSIGILFNILLINFSFDISVKIFTGFLIAVVIFYVYPNLKTIYVFFVRHKQVQLPSAEQTPITFKLTNLILSISLICYVLYPYILAGNFNDDRAEQPLLHGAYYIERFIIANDTLNACDFPYKKFFIHRNSYLIFQGRDDTMIDYFFNIDPAKKQLVLQDYKQNKILVNYTYIEKTGALELRFGNKEKWVIESKSLNWKALPALEDKIHYTIDEIK